MNEGHRDNGGHHQPLVISYMTLRRALGVLGVTFPLVLAAGAFVLSGSGILGSLSGYYHTVMRDVFVGILFAMALFLYAYQGYERRDDLAGDLACVFAMGVALFPTTPVTATADSGDWTGQAHIVCAALFFATLAYFSLYLFTKTSAAAQPTPQKLQRNRVYRACGYTIIVCIGLIGLYFVALEDRAPGFKAYDPVFWLESVAVIAFGVSWLVKGEAILADAE